MSVVHNATNADLDAFLTFPALQLFGSVVVAWLQPTSAPTPTKLSWLR
jgi:hypothetical protein